MLWTWDDHRSIYYYTARVDIPAITRNEMAERYGIKLILMMKIAGRNLPDMVSRSRGKNDNTLG